MPFARRRSGERRDTASTSVLSSDNLPVLRRGPSYKKCKVVNGETPRIIHDSPRHPEDHQKIEMLRCTCAACLTTIHVCCRSHSIRGGPFAMSDSRERRELGMHRRIPRRDFLNGVALGVAGAYVAAAEPRLAAAGVDTSGSQAPGASAEVYPPARTGLRGNYPAAVQAFGPMQAGVYRQFPALDVDTREAYDLVIVGGGISGLAAAHFWRRALGQSQKILILDNHDDFGGHAKRNEFSYQGRTYIGYGGTMGISTPYPYSYTAKRLVEELGIQVERNAEFVNRDGFQRLNLGPGVFFDKAHFGEDRLVSGSGRIPWPEFFAKAPLADAVREDLVRLHGKNPDYKAGMSHEEKVGALGEISWEQFLLKHPKVHPDTILFFRRHGRRHNK